MASILLPSARLAAALSPAAGTQAQRPRRCMPLRASASEEASASPTQAQGTGRRQAALGLGAAVVGAVCAGTGSWSGAAWALLENDDDEELLQRVKKERKERFSKYEELRPEEEALQEAVGDLRVVGKALDSGDYASALKAASDVAASAAEGGAVASALAKLNGGGGAAVASLRSGLDALQLALSAEDGVSAKKAFVESATAILDISSATGLSSALSGL